MFCFVFAALPALWFINLCSCFLVIFLTKKKLWICFHKKTCKFINKFLLDDDVCLHSFLLIIIEVALLDYLELGKERVSALNPVDENLKLGYWISTWNPCLKQVQKKETKNIFNLWSQNKISINSPISFMLLKWRNVLHLLLKSHFVKSDLKKMAILWLILFCF